MGEISPCELEDIDVTIYLAKRETISPIGIVRDVEVLCGKVKYPTDFLVLGSERDNFCPIIFGRPFLRTCGAIIDCKKGKISVEFDGEPYEFNFSKFSKQPPGTDLSNDDKLIESIASIAIPPNDSKWVSPVHCVPKKGGTTVVPNDKNELIPQRIII